MTLTASAPVLLPARPGGGSHAVGLAVVVAVHLLVGYALVSGLAKKVVDSVRAPIETRLIEETKAPPPPLPEPPKPVVKLAPRLAPPPPALVPPPEVQVTPEPPAPSITAVTPVAPPAPLEVKPEPPAAPAATPVPPPPKAETVAIGVACPTMVRPTLPRRAELDGIGGLVKAKATIRDGKVVTVQIVSSKPVGLFDAAVRAAMLQYGCQTTGGDEVVAVQTFEFKAAQ